MKLSFVILLISLPMVNFAQKVWCSEAYGTIKTALADVNGDRKADLIQVNSDAIYVRLSTGTSFGAANKWTNGPLYGDYGTYFADVTGDKLADCIIVNSYGTNVRRSTGTTFGKDVGWTNGVFKGEKFNAVCDFTGDGKADFIAVDAGGFTARISDGVVFHQISPAPIPGHNPGYCGTNFYLEPNEQQLEFADVTGDGKLDIIADYEQSGGGIYVCNGNGGTNTGANYKAWVEPLSMGYGNFRFFADANGNGKADCIIWDTRSVTLNVRLSDGTSFASPETTKFETFGLKISNDSPLKPYAFAGMADVTGDGKADFVICFKNGIPVYVSTSPF